MFSLGGRALKKKFTSLELLSMEMDVWKFCVLKHQSLPISVCIVELMFASRFGSRFYRVRSSLYQVTSRKQVLSGLDVFTTGRT